MRACDRAALAMWHGRLPRVRRGFTREGESQGPKHRGETAIDQGRPPLRQTELPARVVLPIAGVPKWRNWQTRYIQGVVPVRAWRFESSLRHQTIHPTPQDCHPTGCGVVFRFTRIVAGKARKRLASIGKPRRPQRLHVSRLRFPDYTAGGVLRQSHSRIPKLETSCSC